jgi:hypothetical protein
MRFYRIMLLALVVSLLVGMFLPTYAHDLFGIKGDAAYFAQRDAICETPSEVFKYDLIMFINEFDRTTKVINEDMPYYVAIVGGLLIGKVMLSPTAVAEMQSGVMLKHELVRRLTLKELTYPQIRKMYGQKMATEVWALFKQAKAGQGAATKYGIKAIKILGRVIK